MKYVLILLLISPLTWAQDPLEAELNQASKESRATGKPVLLYLYADWCAGCANFKKKREEDKSINQMLNQFIFREINFETPKGKLFERRFNTKGFPSFVSLDKNFAVEFQWVGYHPKFFKQTLNSLIAGEDVMEAFNALFDANPTLKMAADVATQYELSGDFANAAIFIKKAINLAGDSKGKYQFRLFLLHADMVYADQHPLEELFLEGEKLINSGKMDNEQLFRIYDRLFYMSRNTQQASRMPGFYSLLDGLSLSDLSSIWHYGYHTHLAKRWINDDPDKAESYFLKSLSEDWAAKPGFVVHYVNWCLENGRPLEKAASLCDRSFHPGDPDPIHLSLLKAKAEILARKQGVNAALESYEQGQHPEWWSSAKLTDQMLKWYVTHEVNLAQVFLKSMEAVSDDTDKLAKANLLATLAEIKLKLGKKSEAVALLKRAVVEDPENQDIQAKLSSMD